MPRVCRCWCSPPSRRRWLRGFRFDGTAWDDLGSLTSDSSFRRPGTRQRRQPDRRAARQRRTARDPQHRRGWVAMGGCSTACRTEPRRSSSPSLAIDAAGQPWVAWSHFSRHPPVNLVQFDGTTFVPVPIVPVPTNGHPALTFIGGDPVLAIGDDSSEVRRRRNGVWEPAAGGGRRPRADRHAAEQRCADPRRDGQWQRHRHAAEGGVP